MKTTTTRCKSGFCTFEYVDRREKRRRNQNEFGGFSWNSKENGMFDDV